MSLGSSDSAGLSRQLLHAKRIISTQQDEIDVLRQQLRAQQVRLDERSTDLVQSQRLIAARIERLQDECERVAALLTSPPPSTRPKRLPSWLPPSVALLIQEFTSSSSSSSPSPYVDDRLSVFLVALNRIWKRRVEEKGRQVAERYEAEVADLKRRLARRLPYELITQKARILRLQKELDDSRRAYQQRRARGGERGQADGSLLALALSTVENLSAQLLEMERQNDALKRMLNGDAAQHSEQPHEPAAAAAHEDDAKEERDDEDDEEQPQDATT